MLVSPVLQLFSLKDSVGGVGIPMEVLELPSKADKIVDFQWEPRVSNTEHFAHPSCAAPSDMLHCHLQVRLPCIVFDLRLHCVHVLCPLLSWRVLTRCSCTLLPLWGCHLAPCKGSWTLAI